MECATVFTVQRIVKFLSSEVLLLCTVNVMCKKCKNTVDEPAGSFPYAHSMHKNMVNCSAFYFISNKWPRRLHFSFLLLFLFVSHYQDSFSKTHNHLCSCSYHPEILTGVSSVLLLNVHTWINVRHLCSFCVSWGSYIVCLCFLNYNMVKPVQNDVVLV